MLAELTMKESAPKILIVDDLATNRFLINSSLEDIDLEVHEADSGARAIKQVRHNDYCAILMDVNMPGMNGFETTSHIKSCFGEDAPPIVFVSSHNDIDYIEQCYQVGGIDYITKPIKESILLAKVKLFRELYLKQQRITALRDQSTAMMDSAGEGILGFDENFQITFANSVAACLLLQKKEILINQDFRKFFFNSFSEEQWQSSEMCATFSENQIFQQTNGAIYHDSGSEISVEYTLSPIIQNDKSVGGILVIQDITERKKAEEQLSHLAQFDQLTGMYNRSMFSRVLSQEVSNASRAGRQVALHFIDLDNFKDVNDTLGHDAGDIVIKEAANRIKSFLREGDTIARLGGDEFGVIQPLDHNGSLGAAALARRMVEACSPEFTIGDTEAYIGCSVGIALYPDHARDTNGLIKAADTAMYLSKNSGRNQFHFYNKALQSQIHEHMVLANELKSALSRKEIYVVFQPQINAKNGNIYGFEALMRWHNRILGEVPPIKFIPIAEQSGLIGELSQWLIKEACEQAQQWHLPNNTTNTFKLAINISLKQIIKGGLANTISAILDETSFDAKNLKLEITESVLMEDPVSSIEEIDRINNLGVEIAIDDFGTGYSSLSYLGVLPLKYLKIDKSFVTDINENTTNRKIVTSILRLADSLGYKVIAEGVETRSELDYLKENGCDIFQGYYFSEPMNASATNSYISGYPHSKKYLH